MSYDTIYGVSFLDDLHNFFPEFLYNNSRFRNVPDIFDYLNYVTERQFSSFRRGRSLYLNNQRTTVGADEFNRAGVFRTRTPLRVSPTTPPITTNTTVYTTQNTVSNNQQAIPTLNPNPNPNPSPPVIRSFPVTRTRQSRSLQPRVLSATYSVLPQGGQAGQAGQAVEEISVEGIMPAFLSQNLGLGAGLGSIIDASDSNIAEQTEQLLSELFGGLPGSSTPISNLLRGVILNPTQTGFGNFMDPIPVRPTARQIANGTALIRLENTNEEILCAICQDVMNDTHIVRQINHCSHKYHQNCLDQHFQNSVRCPMCRYDIRDYNNVSATAAAAATTTPMTPLVEPTHVFEESQNQNANVN